MQDLQALQKEVTNILNKELPGFFTSVNERNHFDKSKFLRIDIATSNFLINGVPNQYFNHISFMIEEDLNLQFQIFGGCGGQSFYRSIDPSNEKEKFFALQRVKIPFRTPKKEKEAVLRAIKIVCQRYKQLIKETFEKGLLRSENIEDLKDIIYNN